MPSTRTRHPVENQHAYDGHELFINDPRHIKDSVDGPARLGPDLVYVSREKAAEKEPTFRWRDIDIVIEAKNDWPDPIKQATTYARGAFLLERTRSFALVIGVNQGTKPARFMFFHRGGVTSSPELPIIPKAQDDPGLRGFLQMMKTIFGWSRPEDAGFVARRVGQGPAFGAIHVLSGRTCIQGYANQVAILMKKTSESEISTPQPEIALRRSWQIAET
ncbi:hypothetical protein BS47DRAFT_652807 [Hydnum rufescens UP504]|uniref:Uncharacterized protein n=1 Tax=Hydnum rufescens UP504 TaxID=1448309 RepID=A0A9P6B2P1_9AGAM|nr:hypothetical protein BS47DRAFT_652807 [Hydnum rufescens UP504]